MVIGVSALICAVRFFMVLQMSFNKWFFLIFYLYKETNLC